MHVASQHEKLFPASEKYNKVIVVLGLGSSAAVIDNANGMVPYHSLVSQTELHSSQHKRLNEEKLAAWQSLAPT